MRWGKMAAVDSGVRCVTHDNDVFVIDAPAGSRYVREALHRVKAPPARYVFSAWNPIDTATKPGIGGSSAATVCAVLAGRALNVAAPHPDDLFHTGLTVQLPD